MNKHTLVGIATALVAVAVTPFTLHIMSAGSYLSTKYRWWECGTALIAGYITGYNISDGTFEFDSDSYDQRFQENVRLRNEANERHRQFLEQARRNAESSQRLFNDTFYRQVHSSNSTNFYNNSYNNMRAVRGW